MADYESLARAHKRFEGFPELDIAAVEEAVNKHFEPYFFVTIPMAVRFTPAAAALKENGPMTAAWKPRLIRASHGENTTMRLSARSAAER